MASRSKVLKSLLSGLAGLINTRTEAWISQESKHQHCGYDFIEHLKGWMKSNGYETLSVVELLHAEGSDEVGPSDMFLSHVQSEEFKETLWSFRHGFLFPELLRSEHLTD